MIVAGGLSAGDTLVPISNTTVKPCCADGTAGEIRWESTSSPAHLKKPADPDRDSRPFYCRLLFYRTGEFLLCLLGQRQNGRQSYSYTKFVWGYRVMTDEFTESDQ